MLRPYQERAIEWVLRRAVENQNARLLIVLPMGGGKTMIAATLLALTVGGQRATRGLFVAHRAELLGQAASALRGVGVADELVGMLGPESTNARIVLAGADLLRVAGDDALPMSDIVITDEAHRDAGPYRRKLRARYGNVLRVGFTATPERLDGKSLREDYDDMLVAAQPSELIADGYLLAPRVFTVPSNRLPDLRGVTTGDGEFNSKEVERRTNKTALLGDIVDHWKRRADNRQTLVFACSTPHSKAIVDRFRSAGIAAAHVDGDMSQRDRADVIDSFRKGIIKVLSSCDLLSEGIDIPAIKCVVMARPTASLVMCNQQAGRCMRPFENMDALILDHAGNIVRHGFPFADREWTLDGVKARRFSESTARPIACQKCGAVTPKGESCKCRTGASEHRSRATQGEYTGPLELPGELVTIAESIPITKRIADYQRLYSFATSKGFGEDWAKKVYMAKYDEARPTA